MVRTGILGLSLGIGAAGMVVVACVGTDTSASAPTDDPDSGGPGTGGCSATEKPCGGECVPLDDVRTGCGEKTCSPCDAPSGIVAECNAEKKCAIQCQAGFSDCDGNVRSGCETRTASDLANCGACGKICGTQNTDSTPSCQNGVCVFDCKDGFADCDGNTANGCETNLATSSEHCGKCGHDCLGGACGANGACGIATIAAGENAPTALALDATNVYFTVSGANAIKRAPKTNKCATPPCATPLLETSAGVSNPTAIATDGVNLAWANFNAASVVAVRMASVAGVGAKDVGPCQDVQAGSIAFSGNHLWWGDRFSTTLTTRANKDGTGATGVMTGSGETPGIAADATHVYVAERGSGQIFRRAAADGACALGTDCPAPIATVAANVWALAVDTQYVYYGTTTGTVGRVPKAGGAASTIATNQGTLTSIATDGTDVYWSVSTGGTGFVGRAAVGAAACDANACDHFGSGPVAAVAVDDKAVYWVVEQANGGVYARAK